MRPIRSCIILATVSMALGTAGFCETGAEEPGLGRPSVHWNFSSSKQRHITGQISVTAEDGSRIKLGGFIVALYPAASFYRFFLWQHTTLAAIMRFHAARSDNFDFYGHTPEALAASEAMADAQLRTFLQLPKSPFTTLSDAEGRFKFARTPDEPFVVFARDPQMDGRTVVTQIWVVSDAAISDSGTVDLTSENLAK